MNRFDRYVNSNDTPKTLCKEIEELQKQIEAMKCCCNCQNITLFTEEDPCKSCGRKYKNWELKIRQVTE